MATREWTEGFCNEMAGFLFRHECGRFASWRCQRCGKPICDEHSVTIPAAELSATADGSGSSVVRDAPEETILCRSCARASQRRSNNLDRNDYDNNYYYHSRSYYYPGYYGYGSRASHPGRDPSASNAHDPNDLTPADGESFAAEGEEGYEMDMGES